MLTVRLYGHLAETFGKEFKLNVLSPAEACRALESNFPGKFYRQLVNHEFNIVRGSELNPSAEIGAEELEMQSVAKDIHIVPAAIGAKSGLGSAILGAVLIVAAVAVTVATGGAALAGGIGAGMGMTTVAGGMISMSAVASFGTMMMFSGISQMLSPTPDISGGGGASENTDPRKSFVFTGAQNVSEQGGPVHLLYGELEVGSIVISRSLTAENI